MTKHLFVEVDLKSNLNHFTFFDIGKNKDYFSKQEIQKLKEDLTSLYAKLKNKPVHFMITGNVLDNLDSDIKSFINKFNAKFVCMPYYEGYLQNTKEEFKLHYKEIQKHFKTPTLIKNTHFFIEENTLDVSKELKIKYVLTNDAKEELFKTTNANCVFVPIKSLNIKLLSLDAANQEDWENVELSHVQKNKELSKEEIQKNNFSLNNLQVETLNALKKLENQINEVGDEFIKSTWKKLHSAHFIDNLDLNNAKSGKYAYKSPYDAFLCINNIIKDLSHRIK